MRYLAERLVCLAMGLSALLSAVQSIAAGNAGILVEAEARESVDMIELNHFHDVLGRHVYDQVIFYDWSPERQEFHVRAWMLVDDREQSRRPGKNYSSGRYVVRWFDHEQKFNRCITASAYRESWTQIDPERANKKLLDERQRVLLIKRSFDVTTPQSLEIAEELPEVTP
jgi:hypothetical protein